eukprot:13973-Heterococcus_DN1.PRE.6
MTAQWAMFKACCCLSSPSVQRSHSSHTKLQAAALLLDCIEPQLYHTPLACKLSANLTGHFNYTAASTGFATDCKQSFSRVFCYLCTCSLQRETAKQ